MRQKKYAAKKNKKITKNNKKKRKSSFGEAIIPPASEATANVGRDRSTPPHYQAYAINLPQQIKQGYIDQEWSGAINRKTYPQKPQKFLNLLPAFGAKHHGKARAIPNTPRVRIENSTPEDKK